MVRSIDTQAPLQRSDFLYLRDRNRLPHGYTIDEGDGSFTEEERAYAARDAKEHEAIARRQAKAFGQPASDSSPQSDDDTEELDPVDVDADADEEEEDDEDQVTYDGWSKAELQDELEDRGLSKSGKVKDLIARLEADDAEDD